MKQLQNFKTQLDRYESLTAPERLGLIRGLQEVAKVETFDDTEPAVSVCPVTKQELRRPCGLQGCPFWVEHTWTRNCSLETMAQQNQDSLTADQVALLHRKSKERVESIYRRCFKILQRHELRDVLRNRTVKRFSFVAGFCVACETRLDETPEDLALGQGFGYCSPECRKDYTPHYFEIERFFGVDFWTVVEVGASLFNFYYLEELLGFQVNVLRNRLEKMRGDKTKQSGVFVTA